MAKKYKVREGFSFVDHDNKVKQGGEVIELDADTAAQHAHKLEEVEPKKKADKADKSGE